jgi:hypothetical protein
MKIETTIKFYEGYIPPKCRKTRYKEVFESVWANIQETTFDSLKLAYIDLWNDWEVYYYNGKFYKRSFFNFNLAYDNTITNALDDLIAWRKKGSQYFAKTKNLVCDFTNYGEYETKKDIVKRLKKEMSQYLIVDGVLYEMVIGKPYYIINTFGLGANHGGTALFVSYSTAPKRMIKESKGWAFSINETEKAITTAIEIATNRRDTNYIDIIKRPKIDIKIPELFK